MKKFILDKPLEPGTKVKRQNSDGSDEPEYRIIICSWHNKEFDWYDNYVAFFGGSFPEGEPKEEPYVLRYLSSSLEILD